MAHNQKWFELSIGRNSFGGLVGEINPIDYGRVKYLRRRKNEQIEMELYDSAIGQNISVIGVGMGNTSVKDVRTFMDVFISGMYRVVHVNLGIGEISKVVRYGDPTRLQDAVD